MKVYLLMALTNSEYGDYDVYGVYNTEEKAQKEMNELGNYKVNVWFNDKGIDQYYIAEFDVE